MVQKGNATQTTYTMDLVKKADYDIKINEVEKNTDHDHSNKYITTQEFIRLTVGNFGSSLKQEISASKIDIADFVKKHILMMN